MSKVELVEVNTPLNSSSFQHQINQNFEAISDALDNQLQRTEQEDVDNFMERDLDMNSHRIINLAAPVSPSDAARKQDCDDAEIYAQRAEEAAEVAVAKADIATTAARDAAQDADDADAAKRVAVSAAQSAVDAKDAAVSAKDAAVIAQGKAEAAETAIRTLLTDDYPEITTVAENITDVKNVANNITDVSTVADSISDVSSVAGSISDINSVADNLTDISSVANNISDINAVADNITSINTNADNIVAIQNASANAQTAVEAKDDAALSATAASNSATLAQQWATKTNGPVADEEYSAKWYANEAAEIVENFGTGDAEAYDCPAITSVGGVCTWTISHNMDSRDIQVSVYDTTNYTDAQCNITRPTANSVVVTFLSSSDITAGAYRVVLLASSAYGLAPCAIKDCSDVLLTSVANGDLLKYDSSAQKWKNTKDLGEVTATTPAGSDNNTNVATTAFVKALGYSVKSKNETISGNKDFTGTVTATTQAASDNSTKVATTAWTHNFLSAICRGQYGTKTALLASPVGSGDLNLSQPYTNFDALLIIYSDDSSSWRGSLLVTQDEITTAMTAGGNYFYLINGNVYWMCAVATSTASKFASGTDNGIIQQIYGINF